MIKIGIKLCLANEQKCQINTRFDCSKEMKSISNTKNKWNAFNVHFYAIVFLEPLMVLMCFLLSRYTAVHCTHAQCLDWLGWLHLCSARVFISIDFVVAVENRAEIYSLNFFLLAYKWPHFPQNIKNEEKKKIKLYTSLCLYSFTLFSYYFTFI